MRAWGFEKSMEEGRRSELVRCWEEMRERAKKGRVSSEWERERRGFRG